MIDHIPTIILWFCALLFAVAAIRHYLRRTVIPSVCWIMLAGVVFGAVRHHGDLGLPTITLPPELVLYAFLPLIIFDSSRKICPSELGSILPESGILSLLGPATGTLLVGLPLHFAGGIPVIDALLFGALISATDPVAINALFQTFSVPHKLQSIIEGESLLNDGVTVVLFTVLSARVLGDAFLSVPESLAWFCVSLLGAVVVGIIMGALAALLLRTWHEQHDRFIGALLPLLCVYSVFIVAEHIFHLSGALAVISATLILGHFHIHEDNRPAASDRFFDDFWGFMHHLVNAIIFFTLGASMGEHAWQLNWWIVPLMIACMLLARAISVYGGLKITGLIGFDIPMSWQHVMNIGGLRGALSVVLVLILPSTYAHRNLFLCIAFALILFTVIVNTLAMRYFLTRASVEPPPDEGASSSCSYPKGIRK